jgi:hypothetical protein
LEWPRGSGLVVGDTLAGSGGLGGSVSVRATIRGSAWKIVSFLDRLVRSALSKIDYPDMLAVPSLRY